jgi:hypothetical protein
MWIAFITCTCSCELLTFILSCCRVIDNPCSCRPKVHATIVASYCCIGLIYLHTCWHNLSRGWLRIQMVSKRDQWYLPWTTYLPSSMNMSLFQTRSIAFTKAFIIHCPLLVVARTLLVHGDLFFCIYLKLRGTFLCQMLATPTCCFIACKAHLDWWWAQFS